MSHSPGNVTKLAATPQKPAGTGRYITPTEGLWIVAKAKFWKGTPYGTGIYAGGNPTKDRGADCSGSTWKIYQEAGFSYGPYTNTVEFKKLVGTDSTFVKDKHFFKRVTMPQAGDIGWWKGHMAIYDNNAGKTDTGQNGNVWSASSPTSPRKFGPGRTDWYDNKHGAGAVTWYRYWKAS